MKKILIIIALFVSVVSYSQEVKDYTFSTGDTTTTWSVNNARVCYFTISDSSMAGQDSIYIAFRYVHPSGRTLYSEIAIKDLAQTTMTTFVSSALIVMTSGATKTYVWYPAGATGGEATYSGSFFIARLNQPPTSAGYQPKTRLVFRYE